MAERILIVDDEPNITSTFASLLGDEGLTTVTANSAEEALAACAKTRFDLVLLDLNLPQISGIEFLKSINESPTPPAVLVISGQSDIPTALEAIKLGALDYLEKPVPPEKLITAVRSSLLLSAANRQRTMLVEQIDLNSRIVGESPAVRQLLNTIAQAAPTDVTVLITGENGTGKELVATRLFLQSQRREQPFIKVNCPGIPATLFESELFGHVKGAFTGAIRDFPGKFALADGGTIFLDEIGDLPLECQAKLLRVLETGEIERLGTVEPVRVDVRIVCASNRNLKELVRSRAFREDLFYRISVFEIEVPPLRKRLDDVPLLAGEFLSRFDPGQTCRLSGDAMAFLTTLEYPGNVRQLKNIVERITIQAHGRTNTTGSKVINAGEIAAITSTSNLNEDQVDDRNTRSLNEHLRMFEKQFIAHTLAEVGNNIAEAARRLHIDRANLSRKIKDFGLK